MRFRFGWCCILLFLVTGCFANAQQPPTPPSPIPGRFSKEEDRDLLLQTLLQELNQRRPSSEEEPFEVTQVGPSRSVGLGTAARPQPVLPPPPVAELRIYDLADLFAIAPSFQAQGWNGLDSSSLLDAGSDWSQALSAARGPSASTGGFGGMGGGMGGGGMGGMGGMFNVQDDLRGDRTSWRPTPTTLISLIEKSIDGRWSTAGSNESISWLGSSLVISTFPETHLKIQKLLDLLQSRWNARVTFKIHLDWVWLDRKEANELQGMPLVVEKLLPNAISKSQVDQWLEELRVINARPKRVHAVLHGHNGQSLAWVSGTQRRTVSNWIRESKGKLSPEVATISSGVACEVIPMLAHASSAVTITIRSRYLSKAPIQPVEQPASDAEMPRPDIDALVGQSINATVRVPVGLATIVGGGTNIDSDSDDLELYLIVSPELVSAPERK